MTLAQLLTMRRLFKIEWLGQLLSLIAAEKRHFTWAYWAFEGSLEFYNIEQAQWN
jgi:hypothetical protein